MKGHIRERSPGHWAIVIDVHGTGERKRRWRSFAGTKRQAQIECARLISEMQSGTAVEPNRLTGAQLLDRWLQHIKPQVSACTHERYAEIVRSDPSARFGLGDEVTGDGDQHGLRRDAF